MTEATDDSAVEAHRLFDDGRLPNSPLPVLVYHGVQAGNGFEKLFAANGWTGAWRDGVYDFHHYHSTAHEVLGCTRGRARLRLGGPSGLTLEVVPGSVVVIPAGVAHCAEESSHDFQVVGATAGGLDWDINRGNPGERARTIPAIAAVPLPKADPLGGIGGVLPRLWQS
ncbi:cupin domain-containing protein [Rubellimicrobium rubrum]|uniref:cupin domain-containing protein n=1 Tax=Rubellimicrobium rubrum TaxID=2585369 RepID=UPI001C3F44A3|nr:cupin domain-containing protein [Rubellimicrobium rubrum]